MSDQDGFEVPTTPVAPGRDRRPWLVIASLAGVIVGAIVLAHLSSGPDLVRVIPTVGPTAPLVAIEPVATALPQLEWFSGSEIPLRDVLVEGRTAALAAPGQRATARWLAGRPRSGPADAGPTRWHALPVLAGLALRERPPTRPGPGTDGPRPARALPDDPRADQPVRPGWHQRSATGGTPAVPGRTFRLPCAGRTVRDAMAGQPRGHRSGARGHRRLGPSLRRRASQPVGHS